MDENFKKIIIIAIIIICILFILYFFIGFKEGLETKTDTAVTKKIYPSHDYLLSLRYAK